LLLNFPKIDGHTEIITVQIFDVDLYAFNHTAVGNGAVWTENNSEF